MNPIRAAVLFFASSVVFEGASFAQSAMAQSAMESCLISDPNAEWDSKPDVNGFHCRCSKDYAHATRANVPRCSDSCVRRLASATASSLTASCKSAAKAPSDKPDKPPTARASLPRPPAHPASAPVGVANGAPREGASKMNPMDRCRQDCLAAGEKYVRFVPGDPADKNHDFCQPQPAYADVLMAARCTILPRGTSCENICTEGGGRWSAKEKRCEPDGKKWSTTEWEPGPCNPVKRPPKAERGSAGLNCWDLNGNGLFDPDEDQDGDGKPTARDCQGQPGQGTTCEQLCGAQGGDMARWNGKAPVGKQCEPANPDQFIAGKCLVIPIPLVPAEAPPPVKPSCEDFCRAQEPLAAWDPARPELERCQPANSETHLPGKCGITAMPGKPGEKGEQGAIVASTDAGGVKVVGPSAEQLCRGQGAIAGWDDSKPEAERCQPTDPEKYLAGPSLVTPKPGEPGEPGEPGKVGEKGEPGPPGEPAAYNCADRCMDSGGTWLSSLNVCACKPGSRRSENGCGCVATVVTTQQFFDRIHPEVYGFVAGSWTVTRYRSLSVPVMGGPVVGIYFSLPRNVDLGITGGLLFAGDRDRPFGSTVRGGLRWWPTKYVGLDLQLHGRFISTNADLENRLVQMGGAPGLAVRYRRSNHVGLFCKAGLSMDYGLPVQAFMVGYDLACGGEF